MAADVAKEAGVREDTVGAGTADVAGMLARGVDVLVIGAGPAGLAAAVGARAAGARDVAVLERQAFAGGVLPQCVHDGFGLHIHGQALTGPEYAQRWSDAAARCGVPVACDATVLEVRSQGDARWPFAVEAVGAHIGGRCTIRARSVVAATGCRERTRGQLLIPGTRPAGVMTAGCAQHMMNIKNMLPGDKAVILGTGDIGLIMARRLTLEGAQVRMVLGAEPTGLLRNHVRCVRDFGLPMRLGWGVASVHGKGQLKGVTVAPLHEDGSFDLARREYVRCNLLLLACGLIPEREAVAGCLDADGLFVCGNAERPHDVVDEVTQDGLRAGMRAAAFAAGVAGDAGGASARALPQELARMLDVQVAEAKAADAEGMRRLAELGEGQVVCTACPVGCVVGMDASGAFSGHSCERGLEHAKAELLDPRRMFTGTVRLIGGDGSTLLPVRTSREIPRDMMMPVAKACRRVKARGPVRAGDVLRRDVAGSGADLVACATVGAL